MKPELTIDQEKEVERLVALGYAHDAAEILVLQTAEDVVGGPPPKSIAAD
jgi:hypothetical protein